MLLSGTFQTAAETQKPTMLFEADDPAAETPLLPPADDVDEKVGPTRALRDPLPGTAFKFNPSTLILVG